MSVAAKAVVRNKMQFMQDNQCFLRWLTIQPLWDPDNTLLHNFGTIANVDNKVGAAVYRRQARCSPQLATFVENKTGYIKTPLGPDPERALLCLLRACFVSPEKMLQGCWSPFHLLCHSKLVLDHAFLRAVVAASRWLGVEVMPVGFIEDWPPTQPA